MPKPSAMPRSTREPSRRPNSGAAQPLLTEQSTEPFLAAERSQAAREKSKFRDLHELHVARNEGSNGGCCVDRAASGAVPAGSRHSDADQAALHPHRSPEPVAPG